MKLVPLLSIAALAISTSLAHAAVITDPTVVAGPGDVIDPAGAETVDQGFGTPQATLEARSDLRVLQTFAGFTTGDNIVSFTDPTFPDIRFAVSGTRDPNTGSESSIAKGATSGTSSYLFANLGTGTTEGNTITLTISFGDYVGTTFTSGGTALAAGFTLVDVSALNTGTVTFRDASNNTLFTTNYTGVSNQDGQGNQKDFYFGFDSTAGTPTAAISSILITKTATGTFTPKGGSVGLDDFAFSVVPEPSSILLAMGGMLGLMTIRRRRR